MSASRYLFCIFGLLFIFPQDTFSAPSANQDNLAILDGISGQVLIFEDPPRFEPTIWHSDIELKDISEANAADFNNDGLSDLLIQIKPNNSIYIGLASKSKIFSFSNWSGLTEASQASPKVFADFDGNGCDDFAVPPLVPSLNSKAWTFFLSDCRSRFNSKSLTLFDSEFPVAYAFALHNIDKDCPDIFACKKDDELKRSCSISACSDFLSYGIQPLNFSDNGIPYPINSTGSGKTKVISSHWPKHSANYMPHLPDKGTYWIWRFNNINMDLVGTWATFDDNYNWTKGFIGDFNGDNLDDILTSSDSLLGWWMAVSNRTTGIEIPVKGLPLSDSSTASVNYVVGDFDGNAIDELLLLDPALKNITSYSWAISKRVAQVELTLSNGAKATSNSLGQFELKANSPGLYTLSAAKNGFAFTNKEQKIKITKNRPQQLILAAEEENDKENLGGAISLARTTKGPYVCLGYNYSSSVSNSKFGGLDFYSCPEHHAILSSAPPDDHGAAKNIRISGTCCRLPADDILTKETISVEEKCPTNYVATGQHNDYTNNTATQLMQCTRINTNRYQLGEPTPGIVFGISVQLRHWKNRINRDKIPLAFRYGAMRSGFNDWGNHGCLGLPWGAILVSKNVGGCSALTFRQLQYKGISGDPTSGTAVEIFPKCSSLNNIHDPRAGCMP